MEGEIPAAPSSTRRCTPSSATTKESSSFQPGSLAVCGSVSSELVNNEAPIMQYRQPHELTQHSIESLREHHTNKHIKQPHHRQPDRPAPRASQLSPVPFSPKYGLRRRCRQRATWATVRRWRKVGFVSWSSRRASVSMKIVLVVSTPRITNALWRGLDLMRQLPQNTETRSGHSVVGDGNLFNRIRIEERHLLSRRSPDVWRACVSTRRDTSATAIEVVFLR